MGQSCISPSPSVITMPATGCMSTIIAIVATAVLVYTHWSNLPEWVFKRWLGKDEVDDGNKTRGTEFDKDANDDLATPAVVMDKLVEMIEIVRRVSDKAIPVTSGADDGTRSLATAPDDAGGDDDGMTRVQMVAACYSLVHLHRELHATDPRYRDKLYDDHREDDDVGLEEMRELAEYLEYAHWAYECSRKVISKNCRAAKLDLIRWDPATEPGRVGHFVALNHGEKLAIVGLKGTSTLSDVLTDLIAVPKGHDRCHFDNDAFAAPTGALEDAPGSERTGETIMCHEGICTAAVWVADSLQPMIENLLVPLKYRVVICGHSLGAGTACLLGLELRSRIAAFRENNTDLRVRAYATPPVLSYRASRACAPFVTSVVNNSDVIPRSSVKNLVVMSRLLSLVNDRLEADGMAFDSYASLRRFYSEHTRIDDDLLMTARELEAFFEDVHAAPEEDARSLYVPGRVVVIWDKGADDSDEMGGIVTDCGMKQLRQVELSLSMVADHFVGRYRTSISKVIYQLENEIEK